MANESRITQTGREVLGPEGETRRVTRVFAEVIGKDNLRRVTRVYVEVMGSVPPPPVAPGSLRPVILSQNT